MDSEAPPSRARSERSPGLRVLRVVLPAAPFPLVLRRDRLPPDPSVALDVADVLRCVVGARRTRRGPLVAQIEGPGDPLASPVTVLRALALVREHDPDVMTSLVIDGPLLVEYIDELLDLGLHHVVLRMDAATQKSARRVYGKVCYRGEILAGVDAARLVLEEGRRAVRLLARHRVPTAVRFTAIPAVNTNDLATVAAFAAEHGVERVDVVPHRPVPGTPLATAGKPTARERAGYARTVLAAYRAAAPDGVVRAPGPLSWAEGGRVEDLALGALLAAGGAAPVMSDPREAGDPAPILPPRRAQVVAVASSDGMFVDRALHDVATLRVYAVGSERITPLALRTLPVGGTRHRDGVGSPRALLQAVAGCAAVVATRFTPRAATLLAAVGVRPLMAGGHVEDVLDRIARGVLRPAPPPEASDEDA